MGDEHLDVKVARIEAILDRVATNQDKMTSNFDKVTISISKMELLMEKLTNLETNTKNSIDRIHTRIDGISDIASSKASKSLVDTNKDKLKTLEPIIFMLKYPRLTALMIAGLYLFAYKDFRDPILNLLGVK